MQLESSTESQGSLTELLTLQELAGLVRLCFFFFVFLLQETPNLSDTDEFTCRGRLAALTSSADNTTDDNLADSASLKHAQTLHHNNNLLSLFSSAI